MNLSSKWIFNLLVSFSLFLTISHVHANPSDNGEMRTVKDGEIYFQPVDGQEDNRKGVEEKEEKPEVIILPPIQRIIYRPPLRGAPQGRIGGGSRGIGDDMYTLFVLAPDHVGLTTYEQPTMYWYLSNDSQYTMEITLIDAQSIAPLLEVKIDPPVSSGFHSFRLADYPVRLEIGIKYRWFVSIVPDPERRSKDILAGGAIERVNLPFGISEKLSSADDVQKAVIYAEAGLWYDAVSSISTIAEKSIDDPVPNSMRNSLLDQVDLP